jgi:hypothetical protein
LAGANSGPRNLSYQFLLGGPEGKGDIQATAAPSGGQEQHFVVASHNYCLAAHYVTGNNAGHDTFTEILHDR